jgi:hypothetical protein
MGGGEAVWKMTLDRYLTPESPDEKFRVIPLEFDKADQGTSKRVQVRITWRDPKSQQERVDEFWLKQNLPEPWVPPNSDQIHPTETDATKPLLSRYNVDETDVGFAVQLVDFDLDVDPGTRTAANYTSHVVQIDVRDEPKLRDLQEKIDNASDPTQRQSLREQFALLRQEMIDERLDKLAKASPEDRQKLIDSDDAIEARIVTMNRPLDYPDPQGRQLRFFQENYLPPDERGNTPLGSVFRVNYDPGRPIKYLGCALIVSGIFLMFYMRAYFFKKPGDSSPAPATPARVPASKPVPAPVSR